MSQSRATSVPPAQAAAVDPGPAARRRLASAAPAGPSGAGGDVGEDPGDPMDLDEDDDGAQVSAGAGEKGKEKGKGKGKGKAPDKGGEKKGKKGKKRREDDGDGEAGERAGGSGEQGEDMEVEEVEPEPKKKRAAVEKSEKAKEKAKAAQEDEDVAMAYEGGSDDDEGSSKPSGKRVGKKTTLEDVMAHEKFKRRQALEEEKMKTMAKKARLGMAKFLLTDEGEFKLTMQRFNPRQLDPAATARLVESFRTESIERFDPTRAIAIVVNRSQVDLDTLSPTSLENPDEYQMVGWRKSEKGRPRLACGGNHRLQALKVYRQQKLEELG
ncbi:hypothetical protein BXZ70DRAFT_1012775 [Cristinia sonorae]|uniref:Uncharacterized protein n=1 Tax=Cristinia sonorae TaxID=1940300 RepID=A0A8K0XK91_9AGAR|nr:hypothetical protein BXZ70DRAFT_1012775 [Cristinia sonorae]